MRGIESEDWGILRTAGGGTLALANSLSEAGFRVWTPQEVRRRRVGRERIVKETTHPITPGIVFAAHEHLPDLSILSRKPALSYQRWNAETKRMERKGCPTFSVFRHGGRYPRIADRSLDPLRQAEQRAQPRDLAVSFSRGDDVRIPSAAFGGLSCKVTDVHGRRAVVSIKGVMGELKIAVDMCDLLPAKTAA